MTFEERSITLQRLFKAMEEFETIYKSGYIRVTFRDSTTQYGLITYLPLKGRGSALAQQNISFTSLDDATEAVQKLVKEANDEGNPS